MQTFNIRHNCYYFYGPLNNMPIFTGCGGAIPSVQQQWRVNPPNTPTTEVHHETIT